MDRVDAHVHVFARVSEAFPREVIDLAPAAREAPAEQLLAEMQASGVHRAVLVEMGGTRIDQHAYVTHCVRTWPGRFVATGLVDLDDPDPPARLRELAAATGIRGLRLMGRLGDPGVSRPEELRAWGVFRQAAELGLNLNLYVRQDQLPCLELLVAAFPQIAISLDHLGMCPHTAWGVDRLGRPRFDQEPVPPAEYRRILALARHPNLYLKVSGEYAFSKQPYPYADMRPMVDQGYQVFGPSRMMWATDFPWTVAEPGYQRLVELLDLHLPGLPAAERELIMGGNALRVWFGEGG